MPYTKDETPEQTKKIDHCIEQVVAKGKPKDKAIPMCIAAIKGTGSLRMEAASQEDLLVLGEALGEHELPSTAIMKFSGACLARQEINQNNDGITDEGIQQLAETIRLLPLTEEHEKQPRGVFTRGYVSEDGKEALVDGYIWSGMFSSFSTEVATGVRKLSIDAEAELAICGECGAAFTNTSEYCGHIRNRTGVRWLYGLKSVAGGAVKNPAGTGTVFPGREGLTMISHRSLVEEPVTATAEWWSKHWSKEADIPDSAFADKKERKYPFKNPDGSVNPEGWMAAWKYAHRFNASGVVAVLKKHLPKGYKLEGDSVTKATGGKNMKVVCDECGHEQEIVTEAENLQEQLNAKLAELEAAQSQVTASQAETETLKASLTTEQGVVQRFVELSTIAGIDVAKEALDSLREASPAVFETMKGMAARAAKVPAPEPDPPAAEPPQTVIASGDPAPTSVEWEVERGG